MVDRAAFSKEIVSFCKKILILPVMHFLYKILSSLSADSSDNFSGPYPSFNTLLHGADPSYSL